MKVRCAEQADVSDTFCVMVMNSAHIIAITSLHPRCGVATYTERLYNAMHFDRRDVRVTPLDISFISFLKAPFLRPDIIHIQHEFALFDRCVGITQFLDYPYLKLMSALFGYKVVTTLHSVWDIKKIEDSFKHYRRYAFLFPFLKLYFYLAFLLVMTMSDKVIVLTERGRDTVLNLFGGRRSFCKKTFFIPHGVYPVTDMAISRAELKDGYGIQDDDAVFTIIGFAYRNKGYHLAIEAFQRLVNQDSIRNIKLFIISGEASTGAGQCRSYLDELKALVVQHHLENYVVFTGYLSDNDRLLSCILTNTDCFIFPYFERDSASGALSSVLGFGKPIIASDIEAFREYDCLMKFRAGDAGDLAGQIRDVANHSVKMAEYQMSLRDYAASCSMKKVFDQHMAVFSSPR